MNQALIGAGLIALLLPLAYCEGQRAGAARCQSAQADANAKAEAALRPVVLQQVIDAQAAAAMLAAAQRQNAAIAASIRERLDREPKAPPPPPGVDYAMCTGVIYPAERWSLWPPLYPAPGPAADPAAALGADPAAQRGLP